MMMMMMISFITAKSHTMNIEAHTDKQKEFNYLLPNLTCFALLNRHLITELWLPLLSFLVADIVRVRQT